MDKKAGKYISYKLKLIGVTHSDIAKQSNLSTSIISHVLNARKSSERAESAIAKALGYESFSDLLEEAKREVEKQATARRSECKLIPIGTARSQRDAVGGSVGN